MFDIPFLKKDNQKASNVIIKDTPNIKTDLAVLIILDGFGVYPEYMGNAIVQAETPFLDTIWSKGLSTLVEASGTYVGLPEFEQGNSEVGHINIGAGKIVQQSLPRINAAIKKDKFQNIEVLREGIERAKDGGSDFHIVGILSAGGVHGHIDHLFETMRICKKEGVNPYIHIILDGRDVGPNDGYYYVSKLKERMRELKIGKIASMAGRFFSMDRDSRWERTQLGYNCMVGEGKRKAKDPFMILQEAYKKGEDDRHFVPTTMVDENGDPIGVVKDEDVVFFYNYREDRIRQLTKIFVDESFNKVERINYPQNIYFVVMSSYEAELDIKRMFIPPQIESTMARILDSYDKKQLHISETEKFTHITYFFNGGVNKKLPGEKFYKVPSPKVFNYAKTPEMSNYIITDQVLYEIDNLNKTDYSFILINFANPDMVGHTGNLEATIRANEVSDECVRKITTKTVEKGGVVYIVGDHGNCEIMIDKLTHKENTAHTSNPVPLIIVSEKDQLKGSGGDKIRKIGTGEKATPTGILADVTPTILKGLSIPKDESMTGIDLVSVI